MKEIPLTQGQVALVDNEDYEELSGYKWSAAWHSRTQSYYAIRHSATVNGKRTTIRMHRQILGCNPGEKGDHDNHDTLNNQRYNLRRCTNAQNCMNRKPYTGKSSAYKGVSWYKRSRKWHAQIRIGGHDINLGYYGDEVRAARAYNVAAVAHFGEFALCNEGV